MQLFGRLRVDGQRLIDAAAQALFPENHLRAEGIVRFLGGVGAEDFRNLLSGRTDIFDRRKTQHRQEQVAFVFVQRPFALYAFQKQLNPLRRHRVRAGFQQRPRHLADKDPAFSVRGQPIAAAQLLFEDVALLFHRVDIVGKPDEFRRQQHRVCFRQAFRIAVELRDRFFDDAEIMFQRFAHRARVRIAARGKSARAVFSVTPGAAVGHEYFVLHIGKPCPFFETSPLRQKSIC